MNDLHNLNHLAAVVRAHAARQPERIAFTYLSYAARAAQPEASHVTIGELDRRARAIAANLQRGGRRGERAILLFRPGLDFIGALLGCFYAGVVAVPSTVPRLGVGADRLRRIADDARATLALTTGAVRAGMEQDAPALDWLLVDEVDAADADTWRDAGLDGADLAVLQYSSGSTGQPKGVMLSHANLMDQSAVIASQSEAAADSTVVSWLPAFHDMGLVFGILQPLYRAQHGVLMAPEAFIQRPARWLRAISDYRAAYSVAPDFAFELCTRGVADDELADVDLSCWLHAGNAAEPVRAGTIERFAARFGAHGFARAVFLPMYGLAEATLLVTARGATLRIHEFDAAELEQNRVLPVATGGPTTRRLVSCGVAVVGADVRVVAPDTLDEAGPDRVGEILVAGGSVGQGYFGNADASGAAFVAAPAFGARPYLRTGDLGFFHDGELYICGRLKDLILIRGANHHAPDIEATVEASHTAIRPASGAAFPVDIDEQEKLVVVYELDRTAAALDADQLAAVASAVRQRVAEAHRIAVHAVLLVQRGVPKTSSGKVQRLACRAKYLAGGFNAKYLWRADAAPAAAVVAAPAPAALPAALAERIGTWLPAAYAALLGCDADAAAVTQPFPQGPSGAALLEQLRRQVQVEFAVQLDPLLFREIDGIAALARHLGDLLGKSGGGTGLPAEQLDFHAESRGAAIGEPIAIVGIGCRFPGATGPAQFWDNLRQGVDSVTEVPAERWSVDTVYDDNPLAIGKMNTRHGGFLGDIEQFDRQFFDCSAREAVRMDPAHRLMAEVSWEALEDAGIPPEAMAETRTGVFVGISGSDYAHFQFGDESMADAYAGLGSALTNAASRVSHFLNLRGPALAVDTACSSSLSALHLALTSIRAGECEMALAGGVNIVLSPSITMSLCKAGMMAPDGRCKAFDSRANGYVRSEGAGLVLLKPLSRALADGNTVYAVIRGSATNHDGRSSALAAPNGEAQQRVVMAACHSAGIEPGQLNYVEAHGTGTPVGDPIEVNALGEVLRIGAQPDTHCAIGSVKTNIGHTESAAGVAGVIKAALMLKHRALVPSLHFIEANPKIPFERLRVKVQTTLEDLSGLAQPALVGVNSFGIGGTNVHLVLEEHRAGAANDAAADDAAPAADGQLYTLPLSAKSPAALKANAQALADFLRDPARATLADVCHSQVKHRAQLDQRLAVIGADRDELVATLDAYASVNQHAEAITGSVLPSVDGAPKLAFVFSGHAAHWWAMGRELFAAEAVYRAAVGQCDALLLPHTGWSLIELMHREHGETLLNDTGYAQPAIFALQVGLVALWDAWGIRPDAIVGHSVGEIAASYAAGILTLQDAARLVATRARLMSAAPAGAMASVELAPAALATRLADCAGLSLAAINGPRTCVVSGNAEALDHLLETLAAENVAAVKLQLDYAFHSSYMEPYKHELVATLAGIAPRPAAIPFASTVTGDWLAADALLDAAYWGDNLREKVSLVPAIEAVARAGITTFLEIGPHPVFAGNIVKTLTALGLTASVHSSLNRRVPEARALRAGFASLYTVGKVGHWQALQPAGRRCDGLPTYRWDRQRYWLDDAHRKARHRLSAHPLLTTRLPLAQPAWESLLDHQSVPYLDAQRVQARARFPNGVTIELALEAAHEQLGDGAHELADVILGEPLAAAADGAPQTLQTVIQALDDGRHAVRVTAASAQAADGSGWRALAQATVRAAGAVFNGGAAMDVAMLKGRGQRQLDAALVYQTFGELGVKFEAPLQLVGQVWMGEDESLIELALQGKLGAGPAYRLHPLVFEALEQALRIASGIGAARHALAGFDRLCLLAPAADAHYVFVRRRAATAAGRSAGDVWLLGADGRVLAVVEGMTLAAQQRDSGDGFRIPDDPAQWRYQYQWQAQGLEAAAAANVQGTAGRWLMLADQGGVARALAAELRAGGAEVLLAHAGDAYAQLSAQEYQLRPDDAGDLDQLIASATAGGALACKGVLHLWGMDAAGVDAIVDPQRELDQSTTTISLAMLVQSLSRAGLGSRPRLWVVSAGAQPAGQPAAIEVAQAPMWGLGKGIALEHPELRCCRVDLSGQTDQVEIAALLAELRADGADDQVALRGELRYVARLLPQLAGAAADGALTPARAEAEGTPFRLNLARGDGDASAVLLGDTRRAPGEHELEIRVATAVVPAGAVQAYRRGAGGARRELMANQHIGRVVRVGPGVSRYAVGDAVVVLDNGAVRSHLVSAVERVLPLPAADAAGAVKPYLAATLAMNNLAAVNRGTCVFVNGADGALGQAVVRVAKSLGARVFLSAAATTTLERAEELGAIHAFDLSDPSFIGQLRALRGTQGVDVFVNCVPGYDLGRCATVLSPFGRCLDMAACDAAAAGDASRLTLPGNATLQSVDIDGLAGHDPDLLATLLEDVGVKLASGVYRPLPRRDVTLAQLAGALDDGIPAQLALALPQPADAEVDLVRLPFRADATYLITGGLGGLGLAVARRMAQRGARHLVLAARSAPTLAAMDAIAEMERLGVQCQTLALDVADEGQLARALERIAAEMPPLRGVMHAAGTLDNGLLIQLDKAQFRSVAHAKVLGAWNLHRQLADQPLDFFVLFSSLASAIGSPGQSNYSAANAFLDALAEHRKAQGKAGLAVGWGPWAEVGMAAGAHTLDKLAEHGMGMLPLADGLTLLEELVAEGRQGAMAALPMHWARWGESFPLAGALPYFSALVPQGERDTSHSQARITADMLEQMGEEAQIEVLQATVLRAVCQAMRIDAAGLDVNTPLTAAGLDSILALELKSRLEAGIDVVVQTYALLKGQTVRGLALHCRGLMLAAPTPAAPVVAAAAPAGEEAAELLERIGELSETEVADLLRELARDGAV